MLSLPEQNMFKSMPFTEVILDPYAKGIHGEGGDCSTNLCRAFVQLENGGPPGRCSSWVGTAESQASLARAGHPVQDTTCTARMVTLTSDVTWFASKLK